ncbi:MAG: hypothetical protein KJ623_02310 [Nanoarchaeota archaeon]|nr:hypothetical protein [Nanoarchaeota archaeon]MBU0962408.1 hypothetical protein [Nanoarchaeota archaeon]
MDLRELNLKKTADDLKNNIPRDIFIIQTIHTIDLLLLEINRVISNLRERYGYFNPKSSRILEYEELIKEIKKFKKGELGIDFTNEDLNSIGDLIKLIEELVLLEKIQEKYIESLMEKQCPKLLDASGALIGARLIDIAGSIKNLAEMPSSRIQVLGAEKSLFKHLKTGSKPPKFGFIFNHESVLKAENKGKAARHLAAKISIAVKQDYFGNR